MPNTPIHDLPYPAATDAADVPVDLGELAVAVDRELEELDARLDTLEPTVPAARIAPSATNGQVLTTVGGAAAWAAATGAGAPFYGAAPPPTPSDGMEWILPVGNGVLWRFRYNAASGSAFKWEFVGGSPAFSIIETDQGTAVTSPTDLATVGPIVTLPRAGDYLARFGAEVYQSTAAQNAMLGLFRTTGGFQAASEMTVYCATAGVVADVGARTFALVNSGAGDTLKIQYRAGGGTAQYRKRWLEAMPLRVS